MNETLRGVWTRIIQRWNALSANQRRNLTVALAAVIAAVIAIAWIVSRPNYVTVLSGLDDKSLGEVQSKLTDLKIPAEINGSSVEVPSSDANTARVQLAMAGLPETGYIGYSGITTSIGETSDQFNIQVLDALQQSLDQTIQSITGISSADVHIVMPQQQLFVSQENQPSGAKASVFVQVEQGVQLSGSQVAGIQQLVAHSVTGLSPSDVTVTDQNGVTLSSSSADDTSAAQDVATANSELQERQQMEQAEASTLTQGLNQIVGAGNAVVTVHANVTFNQVSTQTHSLTTPNGQATGYPTSTQVTKNSTTSPSSSSGGVAGVSSTNPNLPSYSGTSGTSGNGVSTSSETVTNYNYGTQDVTSVADPVQLNGYTVGVLLNSNDKSLTPAIVSQIKSYISNSLGQNPLAAQNTVSVATVPFQAPLSGVLAPQSLHLGLYGGIAGAVLLGILFFVYARRRKSAIEPELTIDTPVPVAEVLEMRPKSEDEIVRDQLSHLANQRPDEFANLLRTWLTE